MSDTPDPTLPLSAEPEPPAVIERKFPCARCGARLEYAPGTEFLKCPFCGHENPVPRGETATVEEIALDATLATLGAEAPTVVAQTVTCGACAAEVTLPPNVTAMPCPFCGSNIVATAQAQRLIKPNCVLPFDVTRTKATESFRAWLKSRWFAPNALRKEGRLDVAIKGTYVPAWTYDARATSSYTGQRGDAYYVSVGSGKNRRTERRVRWSPASGTVRNAFDDVLVLASRSLPAKEARALEPWDLKACVPYDDAYLAGFLAEAYQIDVKEGFGVAQGIMAEVIRATIRSDIGGDEQRIHSVRTAWANLTFKHILLPVWISAYRYRDRVYRFLVNARTGEVQGQRPYSWIKITLASIAGIIAAGLVAWLVSNAQN